MNVEILRVDCTTVEHLHDLVIAASQDLPDIVPQGYESAWPEVLRLSVDPHGCCFALQIDQFPIGYVLAQLVWDPKPGVLLAMIQHNYVLPAYRGKTRPFWTVFHALVEAWARTHHAYGMACLCPPRWSRVLQRLGWAYHGSVDGKDYLFWPVSCEH